MKTRALTVCRECGEQWKEPGRDMRGITMSPGTCDVCDVSAFVSPAYDYGWDHGAYAEAMALRKKRGLVPQDDGDS